MTKYLLAALGIMTIVILAGWNHISGQNEKIEAREATIAQMKIDAEEYAGKLKARDSVDSQYQDRLKQVEDEKQALLDRLDNPGKPGGQRVYVRASCPVVPNSTATISADAARPELEPSARQDYANLRSANDRVTAQVEQLQTYITTVCLKGQVK